MPSGHEHRLWLWLWQRPRHAVGLRGVRVVDRRLVQRRVHGRAERRVVRDVRAGGAENAAAAGAAAACGATPSGLTLAAASVSAWWSCDLPRSTPTTVSVAPASTVRPVVAMTHFWSVPTDL